MKQIKVDQMIHIRIKKNLIIGLFFILIFFSGCISNTENDSNPKTQNLKDITIDEAYKKSGIRKQDINHIDLT